MNEKTKKYFREQGKIGGDMTAKKLREDFTEEEISKKMRDMVNLRWAKVRAKKLSTS